jgi:hypothetical protein
MPAQMPGKVQKDTARRVLAHAKNRLVQRHTLGLNLTAEAVVQVASFEAEREDRKA